MIFAMPHKLKVNAVPPEGDYVSQGFDVRLSIDGQPFEATKLTIVAEGGRAFVKAIVEFGVSELEFEGHPNFTFLLLGEESQLTKEQFESITKDKALFELNRRVNLSKEEKEEIEASIQRRLAEIKELEATLDSETDG